MIKVKLTENGYTKVYENKNTSIIGSYGNDTEVTEWLLIEGNSVEPQFTEKELQDIYTSDFRVNRNLLLKEADIEINKLEDIGTDSSTWREYRQALRDSTISWKIPTKP